MNLRVMGCVATIIMAIITILSYMKIEPNILDELPSKFMESAEKDVKESKIVVDPKDYREGNDNLYVMYQAAKAITSTYSQDDALTKVVNAALKKKDFKIAINAAKNVNSNYTRSDLLKNIAKKALNSEGNIGYTIVAAGLIPSTYTKNDVLKSIVKHYEKLEVRNVENKAPPKEPTPIQIYKEIFTFADNSAYMAMNEEDARKFALNWIDNYTKDEFVIFQDAFKFADNSAYMNMNKKEAEVFASQKVAEYRGAKKAKELKEGESIQHAAPPQK